jgi:hypothetical protein
LFDEGRTANKAGQLSAPGWVKSTHSMSLPSHQVWLRSAIEDARGIQVTSHVGQYIRLPFR